MNSCVSIKKKKYQVGLERNDGRQILIQTNIK